MGMTEKTDERGHFSDRLASAIRRCRNPVLVGLDPRAQHLPAGFGAGGAGSRGGLGAGGGAVSRADWAPAYARFCTLVVDVVAPLVPAVKPQAACFEQLGAHGMQAL